MKGKGFISRRFLSPFHKGTYFEQCSFLSSPVYKRLICSQLGQQSQSAFQTEQSSQNEDWHSMIYAKNPKCLFILDRYLSAFIEHSALVDTLLGMYPIVQCTQFIIFHNFCVQLNSSACFKLR